MDAGYWVARRRPNPVKSRPRPRKKRPELIRMFVSVPATLLPVTGMRTGEPGVP